MATVAVRKHPVPPFIKTKSVSSFRPFVVPQNTTVKCFKCEKIVYKPEEKRFEEKRFHGMCFGIWKREYDLKMLESRNKDYRKKADVTCTMNEGDLNVKIFYELDRDAPTST